MSPQAEVTSPADGEDRTPGRLQAVWPPPKARDEEEKVGLKYTEAGKPCLHLKQRMLTDGRAWRPRALDVDLHPHRAEAESLAQY